MKLPPNKRMQRGVRRHETEKKCMTRRSHVICRYSIFPLLLIVLLPATQASDALDVGFREISFQSAGDRLVGTLTSPIGRSAVAGVLIIPGSVRSTATASQGFSCDVACIPAVAERLSEGDSPC